MSSQNGDNLVTINVDGRELLAPNGANLIDALATHNIEIPHYCYHPKLSIAGNCRMCMVEMGMPMKDRGTGQPIMDEATGKQKIGWMPKPAIACSSKVMPGLHLRLDSEMTRSCREGVMEFLLVNHPLDCPICDQAGECALQEFATDYGKGYSRFVDEKNAKPKKVEIGPRVTLDNERCILCSRCIRFCDEIDQDPVLGIVERGSYSMIATHPGRSLDSNYSLNTVDICPVGALTSSDFRFKMRAWFLKPTPSICTESSTGVNTEVWSREGVIYRITPRRNDEVNDTWMPDSGRMLYKQVEAETRLKSFQVDRNNVLIGDAITRIRELVSVGPVALVVNGRASVEEHFQLKALARSLNADVFGVHHGQAGDGRLISDDATPNLRGALVTGLLDKLPQVDLDGLKRKLELGEIQTVIAVNEDLTEVGLKPELLRKVNVVYAGTHSNGTSKVARVSLPLLTVFEKSGSFINQQFRLQRFQQAVPGPAGVLPDVTLFGRLASELTGEEGVSGTVSAVWERLAAEVDCLEGLNFARIPATGKALEVGSFAALPFCETGSWHYTPGGHGEAATAQA
ncbi:MAG: 2Fe-2S iron-sulfur cluster-binding protein [Opitutales bacterium]